MNTDGIYSSLLRTAVLMAATAALTLGTAHGSRPLILAGLVLLAATAYAYLRLHRLMHRRSRLMLEAIRNRDYSFRLHAGGATGSERILQDTLNEFGRLMAAQKLLMEQREQFYAHILHTIPMGIVVLDAQQHIVQSNPAAARLLGLPALGTLQQLARYDAGLPHRLATLSPGGCCPVRYSTSRKEVCLLARASSIGQGGQTLRILTLNDIHSQMDTQEVDSWTKLTRVLTHEIMNAMAPITSLSETLLQQPGVAGSELADGIRAIHDTADGLLNFTREYRRFSQLPQPRPEPFYLHELLHQIEQLRLCPPHIRLTRLIEPGELMLYADTGLIRQVLVNLIRNAVQAIGTAPGRIHVRAYSTADEHVYIHVSNNGPAIPDDVARQVFVPFFSTRAQGSGIGLSLSRQIMQLSGGTISLLKPGTNGWNTTFVLEFE